VTLRRLGCEVTVLGMEKVPFERVLGRKLGDSIRSFFESKGVKFLGETSVTEVRKVGTGLEALLRSGNKLACDAVVVGVGVTPNADFVSGVEKARDGSIITDEFLRSSTEGLFAAGDVATYASPSSREALRVEHWDAAMSQGRVAARNMLGEHVRFEVTPFFWTSLFGKNLRYVGFCPKFDDVIVEGDLAKLNFVAYYCFQGAIRAVATMARDPIAVAAAELMRMDAMPSASALRKGDASGSGLVDDLRRRSGRGA